MAEESDNSRRQTERERSTEQAKHPVLRIGKHEFMVSELSTGGLRLTCSHLRSFQTGQEVQAVISFPDGSSYPIAGKIAQVGEIVLQPSQGLPSGKTTLDGRERRRFFRLRYPSGTAHPRLDVDEHTYVITELSEGGFRVYLSPPSFLAIGQRLLGNIQLPSGGSVPVSGSVLRREGDEFVVKLARNLPGHIIVNEQRYVINKIRKR